ncbi:MAG: replication-associated recombination protein A [bacterium]|nr:replication-associated recombination protein A [bacterium]
MSDLFDFGIKKDLPLAVRLRPSSLEEFLGQRHLLRDNGFIRRILERKENPPSIIFWGPPGCGKTTLALIIAKSSNCRFVRVNAVLSGVSELKKIFGESEEYRRLHGKGTILFIDEIHRFNRAQQDVLLPYVEDGSIILIGATTENPYFTLNNTLISRCRVLKLEPLTDEDISIIIDRAMTDERGLKHLNLKLTESAKALIIRYANNDARQALNLLEECALLVSGEKRSIIEPEDVERLFTERIFRYDEHGDEHYNLISAFIKSLRGSDPDASVYWLVRMIDSGEDPRFIARRMIIQSAEDVGNADPMALVVAVSASQALEYVGLPEAIIPLAQAAIYIACAPKSNSVYKAISKVREDLKDEVLGDVPRHLKNVGGSGYVYPHDYPNHFVFQDYLPKELLGRRYYEPSNEGLEKEIKERLKTLWKERKIF